MTIIIITPARPASWSGNRTTAVRWARILRSLGHRVLIKTDYAGTRADLMIAIHAWRSAPAIQDFRTRYPQHPLVVALSGTDVHEFLERDPGPTLRSLQLADRLVGLHDLIWRRLPARCRGKLRIIHQSAPALQAQPPRAARHFDVAVVGHLRAVKDPFRAAQAARRLPSESRLRVIHIGAEEDSTWRKRAEAEMARNPRYHWRGEVPGAEVRRQLARVQAMVLSSISEGGANVLSEAVAAGVPVLASRIDAAVAALGRDYPGYFPVGDTAALARLLHRIEVDPAFLAGLRRAVRHRAPLFRPARERAAWRKLLRELAVTARN